MGPLICTSFQRGSQAQQIWVGTDVEEVGQNILTGDKQWLDNVWKSFCNISILKEIVSVCLFEGCCFFSLSEHLGVIQVIFDFSCPQVIRFAGSQFILFNLMCEFFFMLFVGSHKGLSCKYHIPCKHFFLSLYKSNISH